MQALIEADIVLSSNDLLLWSDRHLVDEIVQGYYSWKKSYENEWLREFKEKPVYRCGSSHDLYAKYLEFQNSVKAVSVRKYFYGSK